MRRALLLLLALSAATRAEVQEQLDYRHYDARVAPGEALGQALSQASPIRQAGQVFHGYTRWRVDWRFWWQEERDGRCRIDLTRTRLDGQITLPRLNGGDAAQRQRFAQYLAALREHELGHYRIGQAAAAEIDAALLGSGEYPDCDELQRQANRRASAILQRHVQRERRYDQDTGHGRNQGAWLQD